MGGDREPGAGRGGAIQAAGDGGDDGEALGVATVAKTGGVLVQLLAPARALVAVQSVVEQIVAPPARTRCASAGVGAVGQGLAQQVGVERAAIGVDMLELLGDDVIR
jgi:hypothetical protein